MLSACCFYIFIVAEGKKMKQSTKKCLTNEFIVTTKIFHIKKILL